jgi:hypothetical protein
MRCLSIAPVFLLWIAGWKIGCSDHSLRNSPLAIGDRAAKYDGWRLSGHERTVSIRPSYRVGIGEPSVIGHVPAGQMIMKWSKRSLAFLVFSSIMAGAGAGGSAAEVDQSTAQPADPAGSPTVEPTAQTPQQSPEALDQILAPIALYPDPLIAQILAAAIYPTEIVEADRWMQQGSSLDEAAFGEAVDQQAWDPSVKALTQFPSILANMDKNLSWTSALGEAYANQPQAVLDAIQVLRKRAEEAGTLKSSPQETVTTAGQTIVIEPSSPEFVYLPEYDPWLVYGAPVDAYPNWDPYPGLFLDGPGDWFDLGVGIGVFGGFAWGWNHWRADWHAGRLVYHQQPYVAHRPTFGRGDNPYRGHEDFASAGGIHVIAPHAGLGYRADGFRGFDHAGVARSYPFRERIGGSVPAGRFHAAGGFHAGGFHGGGGGGHR